MQQAKKHFLKNMVGFSMVAWVSFAIGFIASPIATRLFVPEELAKVGQFTTLSALFTSFCYLGLDQAFVRFFREPPGRATSAGMLTFCTAVSLVFSILSSLLLMLGWRSLAYQVVGEADFTIFLCLCLFSFCSVLFRYLSLCYRMEQNARLYTIQGVLHILITKIAYLSIGFGDARGRTAILTLTWMMALFTVVFVFLQRRRFDRRFATQVDRPFLRAMTGYAAPLIPVALISWLNASISSLTLRQLEGFSATGVYNAALGLASSVNIIQTGFNTYWAPYVYQNYQSDNKRRFFTVHRLMACALTLFGLTATLFQAPIFLLLGESYRGSVVFFPFLFLAPICYCLSETTGMGIGISKKTHWNSIIFLGSVVLNWGLCQWLIPWLGATGAAIASAAAAVLSLVWRTWAGERYYKAISQYRYLAYALGLLLAASFGNLWLAGRPLPKYGVLVALYALALWLFRGELRMLLKTALQVLREGKTALARLRGGQEGGGA